MPDRPPAWLLIALAALASVVMLAAFSVIVVSVPWGSMMGRGPMHRLPGAAGGVVDANASAADLYRQNCATCHGADRGGGVGPALLPATLTRADAYYLDAIANGVPRTAMPAWSARGMTDEQIRALLAFLRTEP